jgi:hypothetical protein
VSIGLPADGHAIVLAEGAADAQALGVAASSGASLRMMDNPRAGAPGGLAKLLVIAGRNASDLESAALDLVDGPAPKGEVVEVAPRAAAPPLAAYAAPRWQKVKDFLPLADLPGGDTLEHRGTARRTMRLPFRLPPDIFFWLTDQPALELSFRQQGAPAHVSVELNGLYVGRLEGGRGDGWGRVRLPIHRRQLQGYNELLIHVDHGQESCAGADARLTIDAGASGLRLRGHTHFARLPDLSLLAHDGFPFTRRPDLGETTAVVPEQPRPEEIASLLSFLAGFAAATGQWSSGLMVATADEVLRAPGRPRDLLVFGTPTDQPLLQAWARRLPLATTGALRVAAQTGGLGDLLSGRVFDGEPGRAAEVLDHLTQAATVMAIESPLHAGRTAVFVTASEPDAVPTLGVLQGRAESRFRDGDVLVASGEQLWMFRLGPPFDDGRLPPWHQFLWSLAGHWMALFPAAVCGLLLLAAVLKAALRARVSRRLFEMGESAP